MTERTDSIFDRYVRLGLRTTAPKSNELAHLSKCPTVALAHLDGATAALARRSVSSS